MSTIELKSVAHIYDQSYALSPLNLILKQGGAYALLGPSGCGKTTLLNILSGLIRPTQGQVLFDGQDVTKLSSRQRNMAQVFQFPVMYESMSVADNLSFPLKNRGLPSQEIKSRVQQVAELLELTASLKVNGAHLSPHLKQLVSLGRGLVRQDVAAILLDEPLTVVDPEMKAELRRKLKIVHQEMNVTLIYVTHDQMEALTFADQILVMKDGHLLQQGPPQDLYENPAHPFVGHFIGRPGMNLLPIRINWKKRQIFFKNFPHQTEEIKNHFYSALLPLLPVPPVSPLLPSHEHLKGGDESEAILGIRPRYVQIRPYSSSDEVPSLQNGLSLYPGKVTGQEHLGSWKIVDIQVGPIALKAAPTLSSDFSQNNLDWDKDLGLHLPLDKLRLFFDSYSSF